MPDLRTVSGSVLVVDGSVAISDQCCCDNQCSGACDEENPCPAGCKCCDGECKPEDTCCGACDEDNPCPEGCYCCEGQCQDEPCARCENYSSPCAEGYVCCEEYWSLGFIPEEERFCRPGPCIACGSDCGWIFDEFGWRFSNACTSDGGALGTCGCPPGIESWQPPADTVWGGTTQYGPRADCGLIKDGQLVDNPNPNPLP
jgi:hypothetical protein